jgi:hypothetical protein
MRNSDEARRDSENLSFVFLAPSAKLNPAWRSPREDKRLYQALLQSVQRFRGRIYHKDSAIEEWQLDSQGGFRMRGDEHSWHLLLVTPDQAVAGCVRFLVHSNTVDFEKLVLHHSALAQDRVWGPKVRHAFETEIRIARAEGTFYVEVGGWALAEEWRGSRAALKMLLASYAWGKISGGCRGACTATARHGSSSILRRIGGIPLEYFGETLPSYFDPAYGCQMEILRFDSRMPNPRFSSLIEEVAVELSSSPIVSNTRVKKYGTMGLQNVLVA